jgi:hypothetical protein
VKAISDLYNKGKEYPLGRRASTHEHQKCQFPEDKHAPGYDNDTSGWVRSQGENSTVSRPGGFDHGQLDPSSKPPRPASGLKANRRHKQDFTGFYLDDEDRARRAKQLNG